jgi:hypothetical protein
MSADLRELPMEYVHTSLVETVEFVAGSYELEREDRLLYKGREVLYLVGSTSQVCGCCGNSCDGLRFITVPGFVKAWKDRTNDAGFSVSDIETITDEKTRDDISAILQREHLVSSVGFW